MTQEVRITVDANLYYRRAEHEDARYYKNFWESELSNFIHVRSGANHKFINVKVDVIPHDNDRDYTEEDAEKHLNGEPEKKRKTYAEDFFEKFPNAPYVSVGILHNIKVPAIHFWDVYGIDALKRFMPNPLMAFGDAIVGRSVSNDLWLKEEPEDADA